MPVTLNRTINHLCDDRHSSTAYLYCVSSRNYPYTVRATLLNEVAAGSFSERAGAITCVPPEGTLQLNTQNANQTSQINEVMGVAKTAESFGGESKFILFLFGFNTILTGSCSVSRVNRICLIITGAFIIPF